MKKDISIHAKNILLVIFGTLILSFGTVVFILPFDMIVGGVSGLAIVIHSFFHLAFISEELLILILTWGLFLLGLIFLGKDFAMKTLISAIVYPIGVALFSGLTQADVFGGIFALRESGYTELPYIISSAVGGALVGVGCAVTFLGGGSTGGVDVIAFLLCKYIKRLKNSTAIFLVDSTIVILGVFAIRNLVISLLGILSTMICAMVIDKVFLGGTAAFVAQIITEKPIEINRAVIEEMQRSTTICDVKGGYSMQQKHLVMVSFSMRQYAKMMQLIQRIDPKAFVTIHKAHEINGVGWTR